MELPLPRRPVGGIQCELARGFRAQVFVELVFGQLRQ
jgi:hypothetical protein